MSGYKNRILKVNLSDGSFNEETISPSLIHDFIGGRGFGAKMLFDDMAPGTDPLGENNELIFMAGPLAGTTAQCFSRLLVFFRSPLTGGYFRCAVGGFFGPEMKFAGFDAIIVVGHSEKPVYLWLHGGRYELRDATYLRGLGCSDTENLIRDELHDRGIRMVTIGPAGENLVRYAGIFTDRHAAGRGGGGAVMGAKNLKAIAVRGDEKVAIADPDGFNRAVREQVHNIRNNPSYPMMSHQGRQRVDFALDLGLFPTKNFREGILPGRERISDGIFDALRVRNTTCHHCMVHCHSLTKVNDGDYAGSWTEGPEYETIWGFSGSIYSADPGLIIAADRLCDDLGLDTISAGVAIGFAYELYERGIISSRDTDGVELIYGNGKPTLELLNNIACRHGFGDVLADGVQKASQRIGKESEPYAIHVKGLEMAGYDPRGAKAHGLNMLTGILGAHHMTGYVVKEIFSHRFPPGEQVDRFSTEGKGELCKYCQDLATWREVGTLCGGITDDAIYGRLLASATGYDDFADVAYLWKVGERIYNLERMFNAREGFGRQDDVFPSRFLSETLPAGPSAGQIFEMDQLLDDYYAARGWDLNTGNPTPEKLSALGLDFAVPE